MFYSFLSSLKVFDFRVLEVTFFFFKLYYIAVCAGGKTIKNSYRSQPDIYSSNEFIRPEGNLPACTVATNKSGSIWVLPLVLL